jgi:hypothetical protein
MLLVYVCSLIGRSVRTIREQNSGRLLLLWLLRLLYVADNILRSVHDLVVNLLLLLLMLLLFYYDLLLLLLLIRVHVHILVLIDHSIVGVWIIATSQELIG